MIPSSSSLRFSFSDRPRAELHGKFVEKRLSNKGSTPGICASRLRGVMGLLQVQPATSCIPCLPQGRHGTPPRQGIAAPGWSRCWTWLFPGGCAVPGPAASARSPARPPGLWSVPTMRPGMRRINSRVVAKKPQRRAAERSRDAQGLRITDDDDPRRRAPGGFQQAEGQRIRADHEQPLVPVGDRLDARHILQVHPKKFGLCRITAAVSSPPSASSWSTGPSPRQCAASLRPLQAAALWPQYAKLPALPG